MCLLKRNDEKKKVDFYDLFLEQISNSTCLFFIFDCIIKVNKKIFSFFLVFLWQIKTQ